MGDKGHPREAHPAGGSHGGPSCVWRSERRRVRLWLVVALLLLVVAGCGRSELLRAYACACNGRAVQVPGSMRAVAWPDVGDLRRCRCCGLVAGLACAWSCLVGRQCGRRLALGSPWPVRWPVPCFARRSLDFRFCDLVHSSRVRARD